MINRRDMIVVKQLVILFGIVQLIYMPSAVIWILYLAINYLTPLSYQIQGFVVAFSQTCIPIAVAFSTPQIRKKFQWRRRQQQIHPIVRERFHQNEHMGITPVQQF